MHSAELGSDDDFGFPTSYAAATPLKRDFKPWHRPRKQYVRAEQWSWAIKETLPDWNSGEPSLLKYLTLPGSDLLDIQFLHDDVCIGHKTKLHFVGFDSSASASSPNQLNLNLSLYDIRRLDYIDEASDVHPDDIRLIAKNSTKAHEAVSRSGPFHVINLDLCASFLEGTDANVGIPSYYDLLDALIQLQSRALEPSLFLLTMRTNAEAVDEVVLQAMFEVVLARSKECAQFGTAMDKYVSTRGIPPLGDWGKHEELFEDVVLLSLFTYIVDRSLKHRLVPRLESVMCYKVLPESTGNDMVSFALRWDPPPVGATSDSGFGTSTFVLPAPNPCTAYRDVVRPTMRRFDVDEILNNDAETREQMILDSKALLQKARYSGDEYLKFVANDRTAKP